MLLEIVFLTLSNIDIRFAEKKLIWTTYITVKALPSTRKIELINNKNFAQTALDKDVKLFIVYVSFLSRGSMTIHSSWQAQIALLLTEEKSVKMLP